MDQILNNLIGNSLKFAHAGSVKLSIEYQHFSLCVNMADTEIGMDEIANEHFDIVISDIQTPNMSGE